MYELSNHLGNVLTTVSDIKLTADANADGVVDSYAAVITSAQDYYTKLKLQLVQRRTAISYLDNAVGTCCSALQFGLKYKSTRYYPFDSLEPGRTYSSEYYRFGFNGKENDNEVKGTGNSVDFGARIYDSRLGRWLSTDPLQAKYPGYSPYLMCANNPILFIDKEGKENIIYLVDLQGSNPSVNTQETVDKMNAELRKNFVPVKVVIMHNPQDFDPQYLDASDSYVVLGSKEQVQEFIQNKDPGKIKNKFDDGSWRGGETNPENAEVVGNLIGLDANGISKLAKTLKNSEPSDVAALLVLHGFGHNKGLHHSDNFVKSNLTTNNAAIMASGGVIYSWINRTISNDDNGNYDIFVKEGVKTVNDVMKQEFNKGFYSKIIRESGGLFNSASDNYQENKNEADKQNKNDY